MKVINEMEITFDAISINESFARSTVAAFCLQSNPTIDEINDLKTAISEAVTNSVVHAYPFGKGKINIKAKLYENSVCIEISDFGIGIDNFEKAREPFFTTKPNDERSGMGFTVMESFMDSLTLAKNGKSGLTVKMHKNFCKNNSAIVGE